MQVFEIEGYTIVAKDADEAFGHYMEETNGMEGIIVGDLEEGKSQGITISIRRLTNDQIEDKSIYCCDNGPCTFCKDSDDGVLISFKDLIGDKFNESQLPRVIAK